DNHMRLVEIDPEPLCARADVPEDLPAGELLEEILDQVLLRQPFDQLDLLDRERRLVGDRAGEIELARVPGAEEPEQLAVGDERDCDAGGASAPGELGSRRAGAACSGVLEVLWCRVGEMRVALVYAQGRA